MPACICVDGPMLAAALRGMVGQLKDCTTLAVGVEDEDGGQPTAARREDMLCCAPCTYNISHSRSFRPRRRACLFYYSSIPIVPARFVTAYPPTCACCFDHRRPPPPPAPASPVHCRARLALHH